MGRAPIEIKKRTDKGNSFFFIEEKWALVFWGKKKLLQGYSVAPSEKALKNIGVSLTSFFKSALPLTSEKVRKEPSVEKLKAAFRKLKAKYSETYEN
jgi:hypothetical protein